MDLLKILKKSSDKGVLSEIDRQANEIIAKCCNEEWVLTGIDKCFDLISEIKEKYLHIAVSYSYGYGNRKNLIHRYQAKKGCEEAFELLSKKLIEQEDLVRLLEDQYRAML